MTPHLGDAPDVPPPPYSETDIYSTSSGHSPVVRPQTLPIRQRTSSSSHSHSNGSPVMEDASSAASNSDVIYTPPLTPRSSHSHSASRNNSGNDNLLSPSYPPQQQQQNAVTVSSDHLTSASAEAFFESRPVPPSCRAVEQARHTLVIQSHSSPDDFPYPQGWAHRDITPEDWQTFLNYLIPNHAVQSNEALIERKLRAEGIENDDDARSAKGARSEKNARYIGSGKRTPVEAQLDQIRSPAVQESANMEETVQEWNEGFFGPRGMTIVLQHALSAGDGLPRMPGSWVQSFNNSGPDAANTDASMPDRRPNNGSRWWQGNGPDRRPTDSSRWWRLNPMNRVDNSSRGLNIGGISIDDDRVAIGNNIVADSNGLRIGGIILCGRGLRNRGRNRSHSSASSTSLSSLSSKTSSSSSDSDNSSVGSLPDYDDLKDSQLPVAKSYLEQWLSSPENFVTKEKVKEAKEKLKAAKKSGVGPSTPNITVDREQNVITRRQVRDLMMQWKALKRDQRNLRRQYKRQRREHRRAEKRERRRVKREMKRARRQARLIMITPLSIISKGGRAHLDIMEDQDHSDTTEDMDRSDIRGGRDRDRDHSLSVTEEEGALGRLAYVVVAVLAVAGESHPSLAQGMVQVLASVAVVHTDRSLLRGMEDWSRQIDEWGCNLSASIAGQGAGQPRFPGAWPAGAEDHDVKDTHIHDGYGSDQQEAGITMRDNENEDGAHAISGSMYHSLEAKQRELQGKRDSLADFQGDAQGEDSNGGKEGASTLVGRLAEIEELEKTVDRLILEADEQFARELAALED
ncbi:hypothetical protein VP1G_08341 [Cytospora mali]|uniref:Uncharacterized protein n=1 Tax=Cytospora mali TaxID=578113 RepID=A0A194VB08_CYTMA|nr:hypothetical protein VP1G_08341 [Valsa mali var. pyri (nom. inval.)]